MLLSSGCWANGTKGVVLKKAGVLSCLPSAGLSMGEALSTPAEKETSLAV